MTDDEKASLRKAILRVVEEDINDYWDMVKAVNELRGAAYDAGLITAEEAREDD